MRNILVALLLTGRAAASPATDPVARTHDDSVRVSYHAAETVIAERDVATARIMLGVTRERWDAAIRHHDSDAAARWAAAHFRALTDEREALDRLGREIAARDQARDDFRRDASDVRRAARVRG
jgi:hypothetical protein